MAWKITYRLVRKKALTTKERQALIRYVARHQREAWHDCSFDLYLPKKARQDGQVAWGQSEVLDKYALEYPRFISAASSLHGLIEGCELVVNDSKNLLVYRGGERKSIMIDAKNACETTLSDPKGFKSWDSVTDLIIPSGMEFSKQLRTAYLAAIAGLSLPVMGQLTRTNYRNAASLVATSSKRPAMIKNAALTTLTHLMTYDDAAVTEAFSRYAEYSKPAKQRLCKHVATLVRSAAVNLAVTTAAAECADDKALAKLAAS